MDGEQTFEKMQKLAKQVGGVLLSTPGGMMVASNKSNAASAKATRNARCDGCNKGTSDYRVYRNGDWKDLCSTCF